MSRRAGEEEHRRARRLAAPTAAHQGHDRGSVVRGLERREPDEPLDVCDDRSDRRDGQGVAVVSGPRRSRPGRRSASAPLVVKGCHQSAREVQSLVASHAGERCRFRPAAASSRVLRA